MTVKTFYVSKAGNTKLANNFIVKEFASRDGADKVLIDTDLVTMLQKIRDHFGRAVSISSAYRTAGYNASIGGSKTSYHVKGQAADISVKGVNPVIVGMYANSFAGGLGVYAYATGGFCHIDTRALKYRWLAIVRGGDSTSKEDVIRLMNGKKADLVFTDPPYGYEYQSNKRVKSKKFDVLKNDDKILDFVPAIKDVIKGFVFVCTTWKVLDKWLPLFKNYFKLSNMIIWNKGGGGIGDLRHTFVTDYEIILCSNNGNEITGKRIGSVWNVAKDSANEYVHATQKPVGLAAMAIENTTIEGDTVLDVFGGSGSTLIACEQLKRKCYTMELDPKYCDVIIKRWETLTGKQAVKL